MNPWLQKLCISPSFSAEPYGMYSPTYVSYLGWYKSAQLNVNPSGVYTESSSDLGNNTVMAALAGHALTNQCHPIIQQPVVAIET